MYTWPNSVYCISHMQYMCTHTCIYMGCVEFVNKWFRVFGFGSGFSSLCTPSLLRYTLQHTAPQSDKLKQGRRNTYAYVYIQQYMYASLYIHICVHIKLWIMYPYAIFELQITHELEDLNFFVALKSSIETWFSKHSRCNTLRYSATCQMYALNVTRWWWSSFDVVLEPKWEENARSIQWIGWAAQCKLCQRCVFNQIQ